VSLATDIVKFFSSKNLPKLPDGKSGYLAIKDFVKANSGVNILLINKYCSILEREGILFKIGMKDFSLLGSCYVSTIDSQAYEINDSYELVCNGFLSVREKFRNSVLPVVVKKKDGNSDIGTCFALFTELGILMITAKHCIENMANISISTSANECIIPEKVYISSNERLDIALLLVNIFQSQPFLYEEKIDVLEQILIMGYPPIPGFENFQIAEQASINSTIRSTNGNLLERQISYLDKMDYLLINAKVKGGNSGSPIINKYGFVCGILVSSPTNSTDNLKLDELGYGLGLSIIEVKNIIQSIRDSKKNEFVELEVKRDAKGFHLLNF
jgi:serine protease Do